LEVPYYPLLTCLQYSSQPLPKLLLTNR